MTEQAFADSTFSNHILWDQEMLEKYNYSGPRYTSYPTALEFHQQFTLHDLHNADALYPQRPLSLYVHIPFCHKLCYYCGCNKVITRHSHKADQYLEVLIKEIEQRATSFSTRQVSQLHFGGGTPTFLTKTQLSHLMQAIKNQFTFASDAEISIEVDPREIELDMLDHLKSLGFNRLSIGVQDFDKEVQRLVNREQDEDFIFAMVERATELGFRSTNLDLIYGLPKQTLASFSHTLEKIISIKPGRLSVFNYAHMPKLFAAQAKLKAQDMPTAEQKMAILQHTITALGQAGYQFIGMDHFALPDDELAKAQRAGQLHRNFQGYTTQGDCDLIGFGVSAISMVGDSYAQNQKELKLYYQQMDEQENALWRGLTLTQDDKIRRELIKQLMCNFTLDISQLEQTFNISFASYFADDQQLLQTFIDDKLVELTASKITVTPRGRLLIRNICMCFDIYLRNQARQQQFSRVI